MPNCKPVSVGHLGDVSWTQDTQDYCLTQPPPHLIGSRHAVSTVVGRGSGNYLHDKGIIQIIIANSIVFLFLCPGIGWCRGHIIFLVFHMCLRGYKCTSFCMNVCTFAHAYVRDPVRLRLRHLYQVKFCSFIVRYPTAGGGGASVYCGHISSSKGDWLNWGFMA